MDRRSLILHELDLTQWVLRVPAAGAGTDHAGTEHAGTDHAGPDHAGADHAGAARASAATPPPLDSGQRADAIARMEWPALKEAVRNCTACVLHRGRRQAVFGVGDEQADWLFIGEGPGAEEDARGEPFVGQAGRLLDSMLASIGLARGRDVYIANVVKCRPPGNRVPEPGEAGACEPFLLRQIALIQPRLIVALGKTAAGNLLRSEASIASMRGRLHDFRGTPLLVTYHPAYLLRSLADKAKAWEDLCLAREAMQKLKAGAVAAAP